MRKAVRLLRVRLAVLAMGLGLPAAVEAHFNYTTNQGTITITGYTGSGGGVVIPSAINNLPVTNIEGGAFANCYNLTSVTIPNTVASIGEGAFENCINLTSVTIPDSVTNIGDEAFEDCTSLTSITVDANNPAYSDMDGVLFNHSLNTLVEYPGGLGGSYTIPNSVTNIEGGAFANCYNLTSVTIPNTVASIGEGAFENCINLTSVTIPDSVTSIGEGSFDGCTGLTSVTIPNSVTSIGTNAFNYCKGLTSVTIPNSVTNIGDGAFDFCTILSSVTIPDSVTSIGDYAFSFCVSLANITIPSSVTSIGDGAFAGCTVLRGVYFQGNAPNPGLNAFGGDPYLTVYYLPGATGWGARWADYTSGDIPAVLWNPQMQPGSFAVGSNQFGFTVTGSSNLVVVIEASTNLINRTWTPLQSNTLNGNPLYFTDPQWTKYGSRFYRVTWP